MALQMVQCQALHAHQPQHRLGSCFWEKKIKIKLKKFKTLSKLTLEEKVENTHFKIKKKK
jgi:hypothetical protein